MGANVPGGPLTDARRFTYFLRFTVQNDTMVPRTFALYVFVTLFRALTGISFGLEAVAIGAFAKDAPRTDALENSVPQTSTQAVSPYVVSVPTTTPTFGAVSASTSTSARTASANAMTPASGKISATFATPCGDEHIKNNAPNARPSNTSTSTPTTPETTTLGRVDQCLSWCKNAKAEWKRKCSWLSRECSGCLQCFGLYCI